MVLQQQLMQLRLHQKRTMRLFGDKGKPYHLPPQQQQLHLQQDNAQACGMTQAEYLFQTIAEDEPGLDDSLVASGAEIVSHDSSEHWQTLPTCMEASCRLEDGTVRGRVAPPPANFDFRTFGAACAPASPETMDTLSPP
jgi:hypothetical protein